MSEVSDWQDNVAKLKAANSTGWSQMERQLKSLDVVRVGKAEQFLADRLKAASISEFGPGSSGYSTDAAVRTSLEGALMLASHAASFARSSLGQQRPQVVQKPIPHVSMRANWTGGMNGHHLFLAVRIGENEFLAEHEEFPDGVLRPKSSPPK
jgi:hypothetical protein